MGPFGEKTKTDHHGRQVCVNTDNNYVLKGTPSSEGSPWVAWSLRIWRGVAKIMLLIEAM